VSRFHVELTSSDEHDWQAKLTRNGATVGEAWTQGDRVRYTLTNANDQHALRRQAFAAGETSVECHIHDMAEAQRQQVAA
jgi:hypothetical protein